jgi:hypothetical protein
MDPSYRHDYIPIDRFLREVKPKPDGSPRRSKFISTYRVPEHAGLPAFRNLGGSGHILATKLAGERAAQVSRIYEMEH